MEGFISNPGYLLAKDVATFVFTATGLVIAGMGLATWKKQIKGTKEFEIAYELRYSVLKLREAIKYVRNPAIWPSESYQAIKYSKAKYPDKSVEDIEKNSHPYVYEMRWEKITNALTEMESRLLAAEVLWGSEVLKIVKPLNEKVTELNINLQQYFQSELRTKEYMDIHRVVYGGLGESDQDIFGKEVVLAVQNIIDYIKARTA